MKRLLICFFLLKVRYVLCFQTIFNILVYNTTEYTCLLLNPPPHTHTYTQLSQFVREGAKNRMRGGTLFRDSPIFGDTCVHPPLCMIISCPPISDDPAHFQKYIFFKKCVCVSRHFYIAQKGMMLVSLRYFVIEYLLFE